MKLVSFQVRNYRSINDSSRIKVEDRRTVLVGRNESGKSCTLRALYSLNPPGRTMPELTLARDYPRDRPRSQFDREQASSVVDTLWELTTKEREQLATIWPRGKTVVAVNITRGYAAGWRVGFINPAPLTDLGKEAARPLAQVTKLVKSADPAPGAGATDGLGKLAEAIAADPGGAKWGPAVSEAVAALGAKLKENAALAESAAPSLKEISQIADQVTADEAQQGKARAFAVSAAALPIFVYLDEWEEIPGHYNLREYLERQKAGKATPQDALFAKLLKVTELNAQELSDLLSQNHEERKLLTHRASKVFTRTLRTLWKDREVTVEFSLDHDHFDVVVSDSDTNALVPLEERSRGFRWYFSFWVTFAADTQGGDKDGAILLLDEPGLFLHAKAQRSLLDLFDRLPNQIIYSTHSPFMVDAHALQTVRTVNLSPETGTVVSDRPTGDSHTLFPLQAALGYDLSQTLFFGTKSIVIEGVTDYWYLTVISDYLADQDRVGLAEGIVLTPAGGAPKVPYMVALLTAQNLKIVALLDAEPAAAATAKELLTEKLIRTDGLVSVLAAFEGGGAPKEADVEDLLGPDAFVALVEEAYKKELKGKTLKLNSNIPRVARRVEEALDALGIEFHKTRPARLFLDKVGKDPSVLSSDALDRFERLFKVLNAAVEKIEATDRAPFGTARTSS